jgi:hypothetical protein
MKAVLILTAAIITLLSLSFPAQSQPQIIAGLQGAPIGWFITIAANPAVDYSQPAAVFANNQNIYFVAYRSSLNEIIVTRVTPSGALNGSFTPAAAREFYSRSAPRLAYNTIHKELLVVWEDTDTTYNINIRGRIFNEAGAPISSLLNICAGVAGAQCFHPAVAYSAVQDRYLVVWQRTSGPDASGDIEGEFISSAGGLQQSIPIRLAGDDDSFAQPDVAFNHKRNEYLVAFQLVDCTEFPCQTDILGHRVNYLGEVLDGSYGIRIGYNTVPERDPSVAAFPDPAETKCWMIAWTLQYAPDPLDRDIHHNLLNCDGVPQGGTGWNLAATNLDDFDPSITWSESAQKYLAAWTLTTFTSPQLTTTTLSGVELTPSGDPASAFRQIGGFIASQPSVAAGPKGDYLTAFTESILFGRQQIQARLWGNRVYIPLTRK